MRIFSTEKLLSTSNFSSSMIPSIKKLFNSEVTEQSINIFKDTVIKQWLKYKKPSDGKNNIGWNH